jgi:hypothetical protein
MLNILNHKGNANQNYTEIPSHPSHIGNHQEKKQQQQQMLAKMKRKKNPPTLLVGM